MRKNEEQALSVKFTNFTFTGTLAMLRTHIHEFQRKVYQHILDNPVQYQAALSDWKTAQDAYAKATIATS